MAVPFASLPQVYPRSKIRDLERVAHPTPFESHVDRYERWFDRYPAAYRSELRAIGELLPPGGLGLEIGVGTARFAEPLGIQIGIDPAGAMFRYACRRGIKAARRHESLFYRDAVFFSAAQVDGLLSKAGFENPAWRQTLTRLPEETTEVEAASPGFGAGAFVVVRAAKPRHHAH
jgi:hypothetical protein